MTMEPDKTGSYPGLPFTSLTTLAIDSISHLCNKEVVPVPTLYGSLRSKRVNVCKSHRPETEIL